MIQRMSPEEEASLILSDVFDGDETAKESCLRSLAEMYDKIYESLSVEELNELIIEYEDDLYTLSDQYNAA